MATKNILLPPDEKKKEKTPCCYVNLIPCKIIYFTHCVGDGLLVPYLNLFLMSMGLSLKQTGFISGVRFLPGATGLFLFGCLADYLQKTKALMFILAFLLMLAYGIAAPLLPSYFYVTESIQILSPGNATMMNSTVHNILSNTSYENIFNKEEIIGRFDNTKLFIFLSIFYSITTVIGYPIMSFADTLTMNLVKNSKAASYGNQRVFAPIGFTIGTLIAGFSIDIFKGTEMMSKYAISYIIFGPFTLIEVISIFFIKSTEVEKVSKVKEKHSMFKVLRENCCNPTVFIFLLTILLAGCCLSISNSYIAVFLEELTSSETVIGVTLAIPSFFEILIFPFTARIQKRLGHPYISFTIAIFSYAIRFLICSLAKNIWLILPFQTLNAFGYALFWSAAVEYVYEISAPKIRQTMMCILNITYFSMGGAIASMGGGVAYDYLGGRQLFATLSITCVIWSLFVAIFYLFYVRKNENIIVLKTLSEKTQESQLLHV